MQNGGLGNGCGPVLMAFSIIAIMMLFLCSCHSIKSVETSSESHKVSELVEQMDSLVKSSARWQQDIYQKQTSLVDSFKQHERNDSSHSVVVNEKGDTIKERVEIYHYIERDHSTEKSESEVWMQKFKEVDSLLRISLDKQAVTDSLLKEHSKDVTVKVEVPWWQKWLMWFGGISIFLLSIFIGFKIFGFRLQR